MFDYTIRDSPEEVKREYYELIRSPGLIELLEDIPGLILILNQNRQIVFMNKQFSRMVSDREINDSIGMRPGECLLCLHASKKVFGCGSTDFCKVCGLALAIDSTAKGEKASGECSINLQKGETLSFSVHTRPFELKDNNYIFVYLQDISDFKTRQLLENIFLHDISNSITSLNGLNELFDELPPEESKSIINDLSLRLTDEIHSYKLIKEAEDHSLSVGVEEVDLDELIENVIRSFTNIRHLRGRKINHSSSGIVINTDETLLRRVLINTLKNALEASGDNDEVYISSEFDKPNKLYNISVKSHPLIPEDVQLKLFQRAYSTKGQGRGWGTYSIRLLTEKYLNGKVSFVSNEHQRTIFTIGVTDLEK